LIKNSHSKVKLPTQPKVQETIQHHRRLRASRLAERAEVESNSQRIPMVSIMTPPVAQLEKSVIIAPMDDKFEVTGSLTEGSSWLWMCC
jgi:hypothetical protein